MTVLIMYFLQGYFNVTSPEHKQFWYFQDAKAWHSLSVSLKTVSFSLNHFTLTIPGLSIAGAAMTQVIPRVTARSNAFTDHILLCVSCVKKLLPKSSWCCVSCQEELSTDEELWRSVSGARKTRSEMAALCSPSVTVHRGLCLYFIGSGHRSWLLPLCCTGFIVRELNTRGEHR